MRTTVNIDDSLLLKAKERAVASGSTLASVIEDALRKSLSGKPHPRKDRIALVTVGGDGLRHGVDLDDNQSLRDIMDD